MQQLGNWSVGNCAARIAITIDRTKVNGDLNNYPLYINLALLPLSFWNAVKNGGGDIRITTSDGVNECAREIVSCNTSTRTGEVHALIPSVSTSVNTVIYIYFGNPTASDYAANATYGSQAVWTAFSAVLHMETNSNDSTDGANNGTLTGTTDVPASMGDGRSFGAANTDRSTHVSSGGQIFNNGDFTVYARIKRDTIGGTSYIFSHPETAGNGNRIYLRIGTNNRFSLVLGNGTVTDSAGNALTDTTAYHNIVAWYKRSTREVKLMIDGVLSFAFTVATATVPTTVLQFGYVGNQGAGAVESWAGIIDEFRTEQALGAETFAITQHYNHSYPGSFYTFGAIESHSSIYSRLATADVRPLRADVFIDFTKTYLPTLPGTQTWDKYVYIDYSSRLMSLEWQREHNQYASVAMAMADIVLDNNDNYFDLSGSSPIASFILPNRPIKIYSGFGSETLQSFVGLTQGMPEIDEVNKTITIHAIDFFSYILNKPLDTSEIFVSKRTDEILLTLFTDQGLITSQLSLAYGKKIIPFAYFPKGTKLIDACFKLMEAEGGRLFMDESGTITFKARDTYSINPVMYLNPYSNIFALTKKTKDDIINVVEIQGKIRTVQPSQPYGQFTTPTRVPANSSVNIWINFNDPVTSATDPVYITSARTSLYEVNTAEDGSGTATSGITLASSSLFDTSMLLTFSNPYAYDVWITNVVIYATPAPVTQEIYIREEDASSVAKYGEHILTIDNDFFGNVDEAQSIALIILHTFADVGSVAQLQIKGNPALQLDDPIEVNMYGAISQYRITKITNKHSLPGKYIQILEVGKLLDNSNYFTIGLSAISGTDMIAP